MSRRLLLVLAGLGAGGVAAVLWSGTAYASTPRALAVPPVRVLAPAPTPGPTGALPLPLPKPTAPSTPPLASPRVPVPPVPPVAPVLQHALTIVPPVVDRAVRTVHAVVPVDLPLVSTVPSQPSRMHAASITRPVRANVALPASHAPRADRASARIDAAVTMLVAARDHAKAPNEPRRRAPLGDLSDGTNRAPQTANGMPFAVTRAHGPLADASWHRLAFVIVRVPAAVPQRATARPG